MVDMQRYGRMIIVVLLVYAAGAGVWPRLWAESGEHKHYLHQARAFLQGRLDIDEPFGDVATFDGRHYVVFPPLPAVLITPLVAIFGMDTRTTVVCLALTVLNVLVLRSTLRQVKIDDQLRRWMLAAFFLGTAYTTSMFQTYETWHFAHIVAVTCLLLAAREALGKGRGAIVGLCCGLAFLSRQLCIYSAVFLVLAMWQRRAELNDQTAKPASASNRVLNTAAFCAGLAACVAAYLWLNYARFGDPFETGYQYLALEGFLAARVDKYGLFDVAYVPANLAYMFLQGFHIQFAPPKYLSVQGVDLLGTSITFASPFVFLAVLARWRRPLLWAAWIAILLPIIHTAFYHNNGFAQTNAQRFTLDFLPVLIVLVALGAQRVRAVWWKAAIGYSIALNAVALFVVHWLRLLTPRL